MQSGSHNKASGGVQPAPPRTQACRRSPEATLPVQQQQRNPINPLKHRPRTNSEATRNANATTPFKQNRLAWEAAAHPPKVPGSRWWQTPVAVTARLLESHLPYGQNSRPSPVVLCTGWQPTQRIPQASKNSHRSLVTHTKYAHNTHAMCTSTCRTS